MPDILILHIDDELIVVNKPAGLPTLPDGYDKSAPYLGGELAVQYGRVWIVHRLDRDTSGAIVLARSAEAHRALNLQFDAHTVTKIYHALVNGVPDWSARTLDWPLRPDGDRRHRTVIDPQRGKAAVTHVRVLERFADCALIEARLETGRTHQIRAHLAASGFPLVADALYAPRLPASSPEIKNTISGEEERLALLSNRRLLAIGEGPGVRRLISINRLALHSRSLAFDQPTTKARLEFEAPYAADFEAALKDLRGF